MILLIGLLFSLFLCEQIEFMIIGFTTNLRLVYNAQYTCDYDTCPKAICDISTNTTSSYIMLYPLQKPKICPKLSNGINTRMISFILTKNHEMLLPVLCGNIGDCLMNSCNSYITSNKSFFMSFTGECLS